MKCLFVALIAVFTVFTVGCSGEPTLDASTNESMDLSVKKMVKDLSDEKKKEFGKAIAMIYLNISTKNKTKDEQKKAIEKMLHGKTVDEIIQIAKDLPKK